MGNKIAKTTQASATEYYLHDLPSSYNLVLKEVLGRGRFLKSILCKHDEGLVLVKVYFKRGDSIDLREYERRLAQIRDVVAALDHPHIWPFQFWLETDKAAYLLRQYFFNNLHDRLSTRPFLSIIEKKWLAFQLLYAVKQIHERGICHGDIKCENVLVTSWNWLYLADLASFKPTYIPHDDPSDFSFFFDTGGRRRCYLAPERFYEHGGEKLVAQDALLKPSMDIFSVGCVIAELFLEGQPLFELSQLLAYRRGQYDPSQYLEKIPDSGIRELILHMIQLEPESRFPAESYLQNFSGVVFPSYFSPFLHNFYSSLNTLNSDARVLICQTSFLEILKQMMNNTPGKEMCSTRSTALDSKNIALVGEDTKQAAGPGKDSLRNGEEVDGGTIHDRFDLLGDVSDLLKDVKTNHGFNVTKTMPEDVPGSIYFQNQMQRGLQPPDELIQSISNRFNRNHHHFLKKISVADLASLMSDYDNQSDTFGLPSLPLPQDITSCDGMVLIASLLCSSIRNVKLPFMRRVAVLLLKSCSLYIDDEDRLQRVLPYVIAMLSDPAAIVRCAALETLCDILPLVRDFPPSDAKIFPEYILPMLSMLPDDPEESVRLWYASNMSKLALTAYGFLIHSISLSEAGVLNESNLSQKSNTPSKDKSERPESRKDIAQLAHLRKSIAEIIQELVMGPKQTPSIRRALLHDIGNLCWFFGQRQSNDFLLPILPAFLNDRDEQLRAVFYGQITHVCFFVGRQSVEEYLLPYIEQALTDVSEAVIVNALDCLAILCKSGFLRKRVLLEMIEQAFPLLCYPSQWVRRAAVTFIAASSESLGAVDSYVFLAPVIRPFLRRQPASLASERVLLSCLKPPVSREVFYHVLENARSSDMLERQRKIWYNSSSQSKQLEALDILHSPTELDQLKDFSDGQSDISGNRSAADENQTSDFTSYDGYQAKVKTTGNLTRNASCGIGSGDILESEKLGFSGFMSPQLSGMKSLMEKSSDGAPLYYFKVDSKNTVGSSTASDSLAYGSIGFGSSSIPIMDQMNKSFSLASSVQAPRLVSGSISIGSGSTQLRRVVHEVEDKEPDQTAIVNSKFLELGVSSTSRGSSSTLDSSSVTEEAEVTPYARAFAFPDSGWRPRGVLVAHLQEHRSAVNEISVSTDNSFFVSASEDSTVKVWDSKRLEKDISFRSRLTYSLEGSRALCVQVLQGSSQVAVGTCDGTIHMFSVDHISKGHGNVVERYSGIVDIKKHGAGEGAVPSLLNYSPDGGVRKMILYSTQNCGLHLWDVRTNSYAWDTKVTPEEGYITSLVADPCGNWFVSGSSRGVLTLWDLRFCIPVNSWQYSVACPIEKMCLFIPPANTSFSAATRPLVYVAAGCNEVSLWNAENGSCHQVLRVANGGTDVENSDSPWALGRLSSKANPKSDLRLNVSSQYRISELNEHPPRQPGIRSLLPLPGGDLLTGGTDLKIRRWDHSSPDRSYCVCGPSIKGVGNDDFYETKSSFGVQVVQETRRRPLPTRLTAKAIISGAATDSAGCHRDCILSLASVKQNQRLLLSSSRDGAIKVWK